MVTDVGAILRGICQNVSLFYFFSFKQNCFIIVNTLTSQHCQTRLFFLHGTNKVESQHSNSNVCFSAISLVFFTYSKHGWELQLLEIG